MLMMTHYSKTYIMKTYHDTKWICKSACSNPSAIRVFGSCHQFISRLAWYNFGVLIDEFIKVFHFFIHFECDIQWTDGTIPFPMIDWTLVLKFQGTIISQGFLFHFSRKTCKDEKWSIMIDSVLLSKITISYSYLTHPRSPCNFP